MSKRLNIILPEQTVRVLDRLTTKGNRSRFIDRAVLHYVETHGKQNLREQLAAGYRANADRDLAMAAEWFPLEEEAWQTFDASRTAKQTTKPKGHDGSPQGRHLPRRLRSGPRPRDSKDSARACHTERHW